MLYIKCPSCGCMLGNIELIYLNELSKINNEKLSNEEKKNKAVELVKKFNLKYCCNMRLTTYKDTVLIVK